MIDLKGKDQYRIETIDVINQTTLNSLMLFYQPIIGYQAISIYLTMNSEKKHQMSFESLNRLLNLMNMDINTFSHGLKKLEEMSLVKTFFQEETRKIIFSLMPPMTTENFLKHDLFSRLLVKSIGHKEYENTMKRIKKMFIEKSNFKDVSSQFDHSILDNWDDDSESQYLNIQPKMNFANQDDIKINFDYSRFLAITETMLFPLEVRTKENLQVIGEYASIYGIAPEDMRSIVGRATDPIKNTFDLATLRKLAKQHVASDKNKNPYLLSCISFLQSKQNGASVPEYEKNLLEYLLRDMKLPPDVINVLVEYSLNNNKNRLTKSYVEAIASSMKRSNIMNYEQAIKYLNVDENKKVKKTSTKAVSIEVPNYESEKSELTQDELAELDKWLKERK